MEYAYAKSVAWWYRLQHAFFWFPLRLQRLVRHLQRFRFRLDWWEELPFFVFDLLAVPELLECVQDLLFWYQKPLRHKEHQLLRDLFGSSLPYPRIRVDLRSHIGPRSHRMYYVQCCTINSWGPVPDDILIHEAVHVWQYVQKGSVYIPRALRAQASYAGYDYGGAQMVQRAALEGKSLFAFNYEQQADLVADYWRILHGYQPRWGTGKEEDLPYYRYFVDQLCKLSVL